MQHSHEPYLVGADHQLGRGLSRRVRIGRLERRGLGEPLVAGLDSGLAVHLWGENWMRQNGRGEGWGERERGVGWVRGVGVGGEEDGWVMEDEWSVKEGRKSGMREGRREK